MLKMLERFWFGCGHCHGDKPCALVDQIEAAEKSGSAYSHGGTLVAFASLVFLLPLATAAVGAYYAGKWWADDSFISLGLWQTLGMIAGLLAGTGFAKLVLSIHYKRANSDGDVE